MLSRRQFLLAAGATAATTLAGRSSAFAADVDPLLAGRPLVRYPEKTDLILLTARPPQLETPLSYFDRAITPNDAFFVRYRSEERRVGKECRARGEPDDVRKSD